MRAAESRGRHHVTDGRRSKTGISTVGLHPGSMFMRSTGRTLTSKDLTQQHGSGRQEWKCATESEGRSDSGLGRACQVCRSANRRLGADFARICVWSSLESNDTTFFWLTLRQAPTRKGSKWMRISAYLCQLHEQNGWPSECLNLLGGFDPNVLTSSPTQKGRQPMFCRHNTPL